MTKEFDPPAVDDLDDLVAGARSRFDRQEQPEPHNGPKTARPKSAPAAMTRDRHNGMTAQRHDGTTAEPPSKFTVLLNPDDAALFDELALTLRRRMGRRVGKGDIVRALIQLAMHPSRPDLPDALVDWLSADRPPS